MLDSPAPNPESPKSAPTANPENSNVLVKTTLITVVGSVVVAFITTFGAIALGGHQLKENADTLASLKKPSLPVGTIIASILTPQQFAKEVGDSPSLDIKNKWTLADGKKVLGSDYVTVRGVEDVPDLCGIFLRGKKNSDQRNETKDIPELALGEFRPDTVGPHTHQLWINNRPGSNAVGFAYNMPATFGTTPMMPKWSEGDPTETVPKNVTVNYYIRINNN